MTWSHMTTAQAMLLHELLTQLGTERHRQYWRQAQTRDNAYTCEVVDPTPDEITAIAQLRQLTRQQDTPPGLG